MKSAWFPYVVSADTSLSLLAVRESAYLRQTSYINEVMGHKFRRAHNASGLPLDTLARIWQSHHLLHDPIALLRN